MILNFEQIKELLPQRFPFLMVDRIAEFQAKKNIVGIKNITGNEVFFQGHFPGEAIMPGALILEAMAQIALMYFKLTQGNSKPDRSPILFAGIKARFIKPVVPGDILNIEMVPIKIVSVGGIMEGVAKVDNKVVARAELTFSAKERNKQ